MFSFLLVAAVWAHLASNARHLRRRESKSALVWPKRVIEMLALWYALGQIGALSMAQKSAEDSGVWMLVAGLLSLFYSLLISGLFGFGAHMLARELKNMPTEQAAKVSASAHKGKGARALTARTSASLIA